MDVDNERADLTIPAPTVPAKRNKGHHPAATNVDPAFHRTAILERAGFGPDVIAEIAREALTVLREGLTATKKTYHTFKGEIVNVSEEPDHGVRGKSAERLLSALGVDARPHNVQPPVVVAPEAEVISLVLNLGNGTAMALDAGKTPPPPVEVIDVTPEDATPVKSHVDANGRPLS